MTDKSAALFRASNVVTLDYPYEAAIESALYFVDEAVIIVDQRSTDQTWDLVHQVAKKFAGQVLVKATTFHFDRMWQEKWWDTASSCTDAEWLFWLDLDEVIHPRHYDEIRAAMDNKKVSLINFPFQHFYGTSRYVRDGGILTHNTRMGRRSKGYKMINQNSDSRPHHAACFAAYGPAMRNAHQETGPHIVKVKAPILHYGWCRNAQALGISRAKHHAWYADGAGLEDGHIPNVEPYLFQMKGMLEKERIRTHQHIHPACMSEWMQAHSLPWHYLNMEVQTPECTQ